METREQVSINSLGRIKVHNSKIVASITALYFNKSTSFYSMEAFVFFSAVNWFAIIVLTSICKSTCELWSVL